MDKRFDIIIPIDERESEYAVIIDGLFMYRENSSVYESAKSFLIEFVNSKHDFNECYGAFRFSMIRKDTGEEVHFSDNSGMMRFYINQKSNNMFRSLSEAMPMEEREPNYAAIAQFLCFGCVYGYETIIESVYLSDPNCYYLYYNGRIVKKTKGLYAISEYEKNHISLNTLIRKAIAHCDGKIGCTVTGGIDSRSVLANLVSIGAKPDLFITGHEPQPDVEIAKTISAQLGLPLTIVSDDIEESTWLEHSTEAADGQDGICGIYRLDKLARLLKREGITLQFGGVAGELYKNSFINQDFPLYYGRPRWDRFYKFKVGTFDIHRSLFEKMVRDEIEKVPTVITEWLNSHDGKNKAEAYLNAGYEIMQARCNHVINMFQRFTTVYNPLMERKMAAYAYGKNPYVLEMQAFQRREVSQHCDIIKNIKTDRGLTCNYDRRAAEFIKSNLFLLKVAMQRILLRSDIDIRIDRCFEIGHKSTEFTKALINTQRLGIVSNKNNTYEIPTGLADRLFTLGLMFEGE